MSIYFCTCGKQIHYQFEVPRSCPSCKRQFGQGFADTVEKPIRMRRPIIELDPIEIDNDENELTEVPILTEEDFKDVIIESHGAREIRQPTIGDVLKNGEELAKMGASLPDNSRPKPAKTRGRRMSNKALKEKVLADLKESCGSIKDVQKTHSLKRE